MTDYDGFFDSLDDISGGRSEQGTADDAHYRFADGGAEAPDNEVQWTPELALMLAILEDAVACYRQTLKRPRQNPEILARQAEFWIRLDDWDSPFSFNNICEALLLDPVATRQRILAARQGRKNAA